MVWNFDNKINDDLIYYLVVFDHLVLIALIVWSSLFLVYPCVYREHLQSMYSGGWNVGLSLCIQGTFARWWYSTSGTRFIPVHTGNISVIWWYWIYRAVYPCAYREHVSANIWIVPSWGLSLCIQGTCIKSNTQIWWNRFIPVHTGNISKHIQTFDVSTVYPCAYREHAGHAEHNRLLARFIPVHTGNMQ